MLRMISQEVNVAKDLPAALTIIVKQVRVAMNSHVCSVYLYEPDHLRLISSRELIGQLF